VPALVASQALTAHQAQQAQAVLLAALMRAAPAQVASQALAAQQADGVLPPSADVQCV